ncbi:MAG: hypothetical protein IPF73_07560 [Betaproteobacteria bacterium]|nr:hypothetical protein [Betaproteobacteria bacterium]
MTPTVSRRRVLQGLGMLGLGGVTHGARAQDPVDPPPSSDQERLPPLPGTVGLLRGQFARLAVVNHDHGDPGGIISPDLIVAEIFGADGQVLASAEFSQLGPNEARFLDFVHPEKKGKPGDTRIELFARVRYSPGSTVGGSLQIVDDGSGLTLYPSNPEHFQDPALGSGQANDPIPADVPLPGTIGFVRGQALRVSMVRHGYDPAHFPDDPEFFPNNPAGIPAILSTTRKIGSHRRRRARRARQCAGEPTFSAWTRTRRSSSTSCIREAGCPTRHAHRVVVRPPYAGASRRDGVGARRGQRRDPRDRRAVPLRGSGARAAAVNAGSGRRKPVDASLPVTTMNRTLAVAWTTILLSGAPNDGNAQPIADKPEFRPGDSWFFHRTDTKDDKFDKWRLRVEAIESPERIATKINNREVFCDSALNPLRGGRDDAARLLVRYPLRVGDEWTFSINFEHPGVVELGHAKVAPMNR